MKFSVELMLGLLFIVLTAPSVSAQPQDELPIGAAPVVYNNPAYDSVAVVEFPFMFNRASLEFFRADSLDSTFSGRVFAQVILFDTLAQPAESASTYFVVRSPHGLAHDTSSFMLFDKLGLVTHPGIYTARLTVVDVVSKRRGEQFFSRVVVPPVRRDHLQLAGPVLAYKINYVSDSATAAQDRLVRNGYRILANPTCIFTTADTTIHLYAELYNLSETAELKPKFRLAFRATDTLGNLVQDFGYVDRPKPGTSAVVAEVFDLRGWNPGMYRIAVTATDPATGQADSLSMPLAIVPVRTSAPVATVPVRVDPYDSLSLVDKVHITFYMLTGDQRATLNRLNDQGKENFLAQFWRDNDSDPLTPQIENRIEMVERYRFANQFFSRMEGRQDGWNSDRGRIYMTYGRWDQRDDVPAPRDGNPFTIWYYRGVKEGKLFVFEDTKGDEEYRLVHSNVEGEPHNDAWAERVKEEMLDIR